MAIARPGACPQFVGRPVIDRTGLTGYYDSRSSGRRSQADVARPAAGPAAAADPDAPNIFTAVQEQLGLKLESARGPVEVIVIDRLEKPTLD